MNQKDVTRALEALNDGDTLAWQRLLPLVQDEMRAIAGRLMRDERREHTLQPTALVHEAWIKLAGSKGPEWEGRRHFLAAAAQTMRRVLVDHARRRNADRRGGTWCRVDLDAAVTEASSDPSPHDIDMLALNEALEELASLSSRQAAVIELRYFGGMTLEEVGDHLGVSRSQAKVDWTIARAWLANRLAS